MGASSSSSRSAPKDVRTDDHWKTVLDPHAFHVLREKGTEPPFRNEYWSYKEDGVYKCGACDQPLFDSKTKYDSGTGWPSFYQPLSKDAVVEDADYKLLMKRTEVVCSNVCRYAEFPVVLKPYEHKLTNPTTVSLSPRPRLLRRSKTDRPTILHEQRSPEVLKKRRLNRFL
ncbi:hypothetical protein HK097_002778 [Rhizophlyctis rosea]|uniref:Peptide-methionine (R)-S-oxide reductase n=1 Tax=Rhizophlyctis rosea TaxID=64517 RepID=A0AAD5SFC1_9FUNG|nr:hypothetical protein HK097_002778 [Rhizophlyctis rosea]